MPARRPLGHAQITVSTTGSTLDTFIGGAGIPRGASFMLMSLPATNGIRLRDDGTAPTAAIGIALGGAAAPTTFEYSGTLKNVRLIRSGAADAVVDLSFYDHGGDF